MNTSYVQVLQEFTNKMYTCWHKCHKAFKNKIYACNLGLILTNQNIAYDTKKWIFQKYKNGFIMYP